MLKTGKSNVLKQDYFKTSSCNRRWGGPKLGIKTGVSTSARDDKKRSSANRSSKLAAMKRPTKLKEKTYQAVERWLAILREMQDHKGTDDGNPKATSKRQRQLQSPGASIKCETSETG
jgi:hypothetical protein